MRGADTCAMSQPGYFCYNKDTCVQNWFLCCWHLCNVTIRILLLLTLVPCYKLKPGYLCCWHLCHATTRILVLLTLVPCHNQDTCVADTCEMLQQGLCCWHLCHVITKVLVLPCYNKGTCFTINFVDLDPNRTRIN